MNIPVFNIDQSTRKYHYYIKCSDECYYFGDYMAHETYSFSKMNNLISNFKKNMSKKGTPEWKHKIKAIEQVGKLFASAKHLFTQDNLIVVPIPPSKIRTHSDYDPRMLQALQYASKISEQALPIKECI